MTWETISLPSRTRANEHSSHEVTAWGYLTIFRELYNEEEQKKVKLNFIKNKRLNLKDLLSGEEKQISVDEKGNGLFKMENAASFRFYKYEIVSN